MLQLGLRAQAKPKGESKSARMLAHLGPLSIHVTLHLGAPRPNRFLNGSPLIK